MFSTHFTHSYWYINLRRNT